MKITILSSSSQHPVTPWLLKWVAKNDRKHEINLCFQQDEISSGDILFLISCSDIIPLSIRKKFEKTLVLHASDLPVGRGWSPHVWAIINGASSVKVSLLEAQDNIDSGDIWHKENVNIPQTALYNEINELIFEAEVKLMDFALAHYKSIEPEGQDSHAATYWPKRAPEQSEIDINQSINDQFDLIRVCDIERFPAFFYKEGQKFKLTIEKIDE